MADIINTIVWTTLIGWSIDFFMAKMLPRRAAIAAIYYDLWFIRWPMGVTTLFLLNALIGYKLPGEDGGQDV